jgi:acyl carrier protein
MVRDIYTRVLGNETLEQRMLSEFIRKSIPLLTGKDRREQEMILVERFGPSFMPWTNDGLTEEARRSIVAQNAAMTSDLSVQASRDTGELELVFKEGDSSQGLGGFTLAPYSVRLAEDILAEAIRNIEAMEGTSFKDWILLSAAAEYAQEEGSRKKYKLLHHLLRGRLTLIANLGETPRGLDIPSHVTVHLIDKAPVRKLKDTLVQLQNEIAEKKKKTVTMGIWEDMKFTLSLEYKDILLHRGASFERTGFLDKLTDTLTLSGLFNKVVFQGPKPVDLLASKQFLQGVLYRQGGQPIAFGPDQIPINLDTPSSEWTLNLDGNNVIVVQGANYFIILLPTPSAAMSAKDAVLKKAKSGDVLIIDDQPGDGFSSVKLADYLKQATRGRTFDTRSQPRWGRRGRGEDMKFPSSTEIIQFLTELSKKEYKGTVIVNARIVDEGQNFINSQAFLNELIALKSTFPIVAFSTHFKSVSIFGTVQAVPHDVDFIAEALKKTFDRVVKSNEAYRSPFDLNEELLIEIPDGKQRQFVLSNHEVSIEYTLTHTGDKVQIKNTLNGISVSQLKSELSAGESKETYGITCTFDGTNLRIKNTHEDSEIEVSKVDEAMISLSGQAPLTEESILLTIQQIISKDPFGHPADLVNYGTNLETDLGFDSIDIAALRAELETAFNITISEEEMAGLKQVSQIASLIKTKSTDKAMNARTTINIELGEGEYGLNKQFLKNVKLLTADILRTMVSFKEAPVWANKDHGKILYGQIVSKEESGLTVPKESEQNPIPDKSIDPLPIIKDLMLEFQKFLKDKGNNTLIDERLQEFTQAGLSLLLYQLQWYAKRLDAEGRDTTDYYEIIALWKEFSIETISKLEDLMEKSYIYKAPTPAPAPDGTRKIHLPFVDVRDMPQSSVVNESGQTLEIKKRRIKTGRLSPEADRFQILVNGVAVPTRFTDGFKPDDIVGISGKFLVISHPLQALKSNVIDYVEVFYMTGKRIEPVAWPDIVVASSSPFYRTYEGIPYIDPALFNQEGNLVLRSDMREIGTVYLDALEKRQLRAEAGTDKAMRVANNEQAFPHGETAYVDTADGQKFDGSNENIVHITGMYKGKPVDIKFQVASVTQDEEHWKTVINPLFDKGSGFEHVYISRDRWVISQAGEKVLYVDVGERAYITHVTESPLVDAKIKYSQDRAMVRGGIDLDRAKMQMNVDKQGDGVQMQFDRAMIQKIKQEGFDGVEFKINSIVPVNLPLFLGLRKEEEELCFAKS